MSPDPNMNQSSEDNRSSSELSITVSPGAPLEGSEGIMPLPAHETPNVVSESEKPVRAGQIGEGSYEGTRGYANSVKAYMGSANVNQDAKAAAPHSASEARELIDAESEAASRSKAPGK